METTKKQKIIKLLVGVVIAILLFLSSGLKLPVLDTTTDAYFSEAITKAGLAYTTCRVINASVSIVKDSRLQLEPAGVGISLAVGQALDPIDDMTERLSDVLVTAITSLGVQKLAYEIGVSLALPMLSIFLIVLIVLAWFENERLKSFQKIIIRFALLIVIARFFLPISSMANKFVNKHYFDDHISDASKNLAVGSAELEKLKDFSLPEIDGILGTIENSASFIKRKTAEFKDSLVVTVSHMGDIIESLLKLTFLYVGFFLIQVVILPLLSFWFLVKIINALFNTTISSSLHHSKLSKNEYVPPITPADS